MRKGHDDDRLEVSDHVHRQHMPKPFTTRVDRQHRSSCGSTSSSSSALVVAECFFVLLHSWQHTLQSFVFDYSTWFVFNSYSTWYDPSFLWHRRHKADLLHGSSVIQHHRAILQFESAPRLTQIQIIGLVGPASVVVTGIINGLVTGNS